MIYTGKYSNIKFHFFYVDRFSFIFTSQYLQLVVLNKLFRDKERLLMSHLSI